MGFTVNIGISSNKLLSKITSDFKKPDNIYCLFPHEVKEKMWPLPVEDLFMVGRVTFRIKGEDDTLKVIKVDKVLKRKVEKLAGNLMQVFMCTEIINGRETIIELKYEINTCKWIFFKI